MIARLKRLFSTEEVVRWESRGEEIKPYTPSTRDRNMRVSDLEELTDLSNDDYVLVVDTSKQESCKVKLSTLRKYIKG